MFAAFQTHDRYGRYRSIDTQATRSERSENQSLIAIGLCYASKIRRVFDNSHAHCHARLNLPADKVRCAIVIESLEEPHHAATPS
jgi:hypothetical protein